jgi:hypothetical protein
MPPRSVARYYARAKELLADRLFTLEEEGVVGLNQQSHSPSSAAGPDILRPAVGGVMVEGRQAGESDSAATVELSRMIAGGRIAQVIAVAAELGIPDLLRDGPRSDAELAAATGTHAPSLSRLMRALASIGLVRMAGDSYILTPQGAALRSDDPDRRDLFARYMGSDANWRAWGRLLHSIRTGEAAFPEVFGMPRWEYQEQHPEFDRLFNEMMTVGSRSRQDAILAAYDFSRFGTVVDIAGGHGQLLGAILQ